MESFFIYKLIFSAMLGAVLGSFVNVLIVRWHEDKPLGGRSHCPKCKKTIKPRHLIPLVSWLWLKGRCAYCGKKISTQYVLVEVAALLLAVVASLRWDPFSQPMFWFEMVFSIGLLVPVVMDLRWKEVPVEQLVALGLFAAAFRLADGGWVAAASIAYGALAAALFFGLQILLSRGRWLGQGDWWFGLMMGMALGWPLAPFGILLAYLFGSIAAIAGLGVGKFTRRTQLAFAPALALGTMCAIWFSAPLLRMYEIYYSL
jgi:prepilin signal peptidase PulO-like enzyme (type II secretory pathway)